MKKKLLASVLSTSLIFSSILPISASAVSRSYLYNSYYNKSVQSNYTVTRYYPGNTTNSNNTTIKINSWNKQTNTSHASQQSSSNPYSYYYKKYNTTSQQTPKREPITPPKDTNKKEPVNEDTTPQSNNQNNNAEVPVVEQPKNETNSPIRQFEIEVVKLVNVERQKQGFEPLKENIKLSSVARTKSEDMRDKGYFSHTSPIYGSPFDMIKKFGIQYMAAGENIAKGQRTPEAVVNAWMNSSGHRANILSKNYTEIGVGYAVDKNGISYWTQMFINPK